MKAYVKEFDKYKYDDQVRFLSMTKFVYNNAKNTNINYISFKLNCSFHLLTSY